VSIIIHVGSIFILSDWEIICKQNFPFSMQGYQWFGWCCIRGAAIAIVPLVPNGLPSCPDPLLLLFLVNNGHLLCLLK
jgi:hypothetical protein